MLIVKSPVGVVDAKSRSPTLPAREFQVEFRQLRYFVAAAEELQFSLAAAREKVAPSTLGQQITALEKEIGGRLFHRTTRRVRLTPAGQVLLPEARRVLAAVERAQRVARLAAKGQLGVLRLGVPTTGTPPPLDEALLRCSKLHPGLHVDEHPGHSAEHAAALTAGTLDAAFVYGPSAHGRALGYQRLVDVGLVLACSSDGRVAGQNKTTFNGTAGRAVALDAAFSPGLTTKMIAAVCQVPEADVIGLESLEALLLAVAGGAVTVIPEAVANTVTWRGVRYRRLGAAAPVMELGIAWPDREQPPLVACLAAAVAAEQDPALLD